MPGHAGLGRPDVNRNDDEFSQRVGEIEGGGDFRAGDGSRRGCEILYIYLE